MFRKLLQLARDCSTIDLVGVARELGVSVADVRRMVQVLERLGYLERVVLGCNQPCESCSLQPICSLKHTPRLWHLSSKSEKVFISK
jgi:DNA-binding Lrp family transcriptional regulator